MVCIKHTAHPINVNAPSEDESMASDKALETSIQQREASTEATSSHYADSDRESQSGCSVDSETAYDNSGRLKVVMVAAAAGITYNFGPSSVTKARVESMENYTHYFPKGYGRAPGTELVLEPHAKMPSE
jgi:hypothetical protein